MCRRNRLNSHKYNRLTWNGRRPRGTPAGSAPKGYTPGPPRASITPLLLLFAPGTLAAAESTKGRFGGPAADVDELVGPFGRLSRDPGVEAVEAVEAAAAVPVADLGTQASSRPGTAVSGLAVEPDALPTAGAGVRVGWPVGALAAADRRAFAPSPGGLAAG